MHRINQAIKNKELVLGIFIDLTKAFDTTDHKTLLAKLRSYGFHCPGHCPLFN